MNTKSMRKTIEKEFSDVCENASIKISVTDFFMEGGFHSNGSLQEKCEFYTGAVKFADFIRVISSVIDEKEAFVCSFVRHQKNYYCWKDIKKFDAFNKLRSELKQNEMIKINTSNNLVDLIVECNLRYFSRIMFYFPQNAIFIRPDMHCYLEIYGKQCQLDSIYPLLCKETYGEYIIEYEATEKN